MFSREEIFALLSDEGAMLAHGFDAAVIGITFGANMVAVYSVQGCLEVLVGEDEMSVTDDLE